MKIFMISQSHNNGWDTFDSAVVIAESEEAAKVMHPCVSSKDIENSWAVPKYVTVTYIGEAPSDAEPAVVLASFNAG